MHFYRSTITQDNHHHDNHHHRHHHHFVIFFYFNRAHYRIQRRKAYRTTYKNEPQDERCIDIPVLMQIRPFVKGKHYVGKAVQTRL